MSTAAKKKRNIIDTTVHLYSRHGITKVSMDEIAGIANVSKVTIYKYFVDKYHLQARVCEALTSQYRGKTQALLESGTSLPAKMMQYVSIATEFIHSGHLSLCRELAMRNDEAKAAYLNHKDLVKNQIEKLIRQGKEQQLIRADIGDIALYHYISMGLCYFEHDKVYQNKILHDERFAQSFLTLIWQNIFIDTALFDNAMRAEAENND